MTCVYNLMYVVYVLIVTIGKAGGSHKSGSRRRGMAMIKCRNRSLCMIDHHNFCCMECQHRIDHSNKTLCRDRCTSEPIDSDGYVCEGAIFPDWEGD